MTAEHPETVFISGGGSGIGRYLARHYLGRRMRVAFCATDAARLREWYRAVFGMARGSGALFTLPPTAGSPPRSLSARRWLWGLSGFATQHPLSKTGSAPMPPGRQSGSA